MECEICGRTSDEGYEIIWAIGGAVMCRGCKEEMEAFGVYDDALLDGIHPVAEMDVWYEVDTDTTWEE